MGIFSILFISLQAGIDCVNVEHKYTKMFVGQIKVLMCHLEITKMP